MPVPASQSPFKQLLGFPYAVRPALVCTEIRAVQSYHLCIFFKFYSSLDTSKRLVMAMFPPI